MRSTHWNSLNFFLSSFSTLPFPFPLSCSVYLFEGTRSSIQPSFPHLALSHSLVTPYPPWLHSCVSIATFFWPWVPRVVMVTFRGFIRSESPSFILESLCYRQCLSSRGDPSGLAGSPVCGQPLLVVVPIH